MPAWRQPYLPVARGCLRRQRGQALVFGFFLLMAGLAGLYFLFNTGQLTAEKTRLVTTADAVAHGAGTLLDALPQPRRSYWTAVQAGSQRGWVASQWITPADQP